MTADTGVAVWDAGRGEEICRIEGGMRQAGSAFYPWETKALLNENGSLVAVSNATGNFRSASSPQRSPFDVETGRLQDVRKRSCVHLRPSDSPRTARGWSLARFSGGRSGDAAHNQALSRAACGTLKMESCCVNSQTGRRRRQRRRSLDCDGMPRLRVGPSASPNADTSSVTIWDARTGRTCRL